MPAPNCIREIGGIRLLRAESTILLQEYDADVCPDTLRDAITVAHHANGFRFMVFKPGRKPDFETLARKFRERFPVCGCPDCPFPEEP